MKADSGASKTYLKIEHAHFLKDISSLSNGPSAILPDKSKIKATQKGNLRLHPSFNHQALVFSATPKRISRIYWSVMQ